MKLSYYGYCVRRHTTNQRYRHNLQGFFNAFCAFSDTTYKQRFHNGGEQLYLLPLRGNLYMFLMTRSQEIIKKIHRRKLTVAEIRAMLQRDESIGFASYVLVELSFP